MREGGILMEQSGTKKMLFYYLASTQLGTFYFKDGGTLWYKKEKSNHFSFY